MATPLNIIHTNYFSSKIWALSSICIKKKERKNVDLSVTDIQAHRVIFKSLHLSPPTYSWLSHE